MFLYTLYPLSIFKQLFKTPFRLTILATVTFNLYPCFSSVSLFCYSFFDHFFYFHPNFFQRISFVYLYSCWILPHISLYSSFHFITPFASFPYCFLSGILAYYITAYDLTQFYPNSSSSRNLSMFNTVCLMLPKHSYRRLHHHY